MEADRPRREYRVSHVVDGEFVDLLRQKHSKHYDFATRFSTLLKMSTGRKFAWSIFRTRPARGFRNTAARYCLIDAVLYFALLAGIWLGIASCAAMVRDARALPALLTMRSKLGTRGRCLRSSP
jgi:hypothetical protein